MPHEVTNPFTAKQTRVLVGRAEGLSLREIATREGVSRQAIKARSALAMRSLSAEQRQRYFDLLRLKCKVRPLQLSICV